MSIAETKRGPNLCVSALSKNHPVGTTESASSRVRDPISLCDSARFASQFYRRYFLRFLSFSFLYLRKCIAQLPRHVSARSSLHGGMPDQVLNLFFWANYKDKCKSVSPVECEESQRLDRSLCNIEKKQWAQKHFLWTT